MRLINADEFIDDLDNWSNRGFMPTFDDIRKDAYSCEVYNAVLVVRCMDCKFSRKRKDAYLACDIKDEVHRGDWYCADGRRRDD